jgi:hypothetical protein
MSLCSLFVCLSVCNASPIYRAVRVSHLHSEEMLYGLLQIWNLEMVINWEGFGIWGGGGNAPW